MSLAGKDGTVDGANNATQISTWNLSEVAEPLDVTNFESEDGFREFVVGLLSATGSLSAFGTRPTTGTASALVLDVGETAGDLRLSGAAIFGEVETDTPVDGVIEHSVDFTINGKLTVTTVP